ncbi:MAG: response regulator transcription factor [Actinobacteria bacterium]|nr:MAG: response regulator transcription factor [Actinomycetota bacterium]
MKTVLIVDDYQPFRDSARGLLESGDFDVVGEAEDGHGAVRLAEELRPEVVLLDVHMPDLDGFEVARRLARLEQPPVVVLTSSRDDYAALVPGSAAHAFVRKDALSAEALEAAVRDLS